MKLHPECNLAWGRSDIIEEVGPGAGALDQDASVAGKPVVLVHQVLEPLALEAGGSKALHLGKLLVPRERPWRGVDTSVGERQQVVPDGRPVEQGMVRLVRVAHEAVVASGLALFLRLGGVSLVLSGVGVVVADLQGLPGDSAEGIGVHHQLPEDTRAPFG